MAFIGILLVDLVFIFLLLSALGLVIFGICFIVFFILSKKDKTKKIRKILKIVFGILTIVCFIPLLIAGILLSGTQYDKITYNGKNYKIKKEVVDKFYLEISMGDIEDIDKYLSENPELVNSKNYEGLGPLGYAIKNEKLDVIKYLVGKGMDLNSISNESEIGILEYMFKYDYYNDEILEYVLGQDNLDVNKCRSAMPVAQLYIKSIVKDKEISDKELIAFQKMLDKGLDLSLTNGTDTSTYVYVNASVSDDVANVDKLRNMIENKENDYE